MPVLALVALASTLAALAPPPADLDLYRARRERLREAIGEDAIGVVLAASESEDGELRQSPDFFYLTGLAETADAVLVLVPGKGDDTETLYLPSRDRAEERWVGAALDPGDLDPKTGEPDAARAETMALTGLRGVKARGALDRDFENHLDRGRALAIATQSVARGRPLTPELALARDLRERHPGLALKPLGKETAKLRAIKAPSEIEAMEQAIAMTLDAERAVAGALRPGMREYEVRALLEWVFTSRGAERPAFPSIVGSGPNSTVLHYRSGDRAMQAGELVVVDIGAEVRGYAADVTRTFPVSGRFTDREREIYDIVLRAQDAALRAVKPGAKLRSGVHAAAKKVIEDAGFGKFFPHGTSHYVGLEVHDVGERDGVLEPGMVITVEPGIYLPAEALGVRIEDMVLVTKDGYRLLTDGLPRKAQEIEALMAARRLEAGSAGPAGAPLGPPRTDRREEGAGAVPGGSSEGAASVGGGPPLGAPGGEPGGAEVKHP